MKKAEQKAINDIIIDVQADLCNCLVWFGTNRVSKLRHCKAEVFETNGYYYLKSYNTIVACIGQADGVCYDFLRYVYGYTATTAQHIAKFARDYNATAKLTYYPI